MERDITQRLLSLFLADGFLTRIIAPRSRHILATLEGGAREKDFLQEKVDEVKRCLPNNASIRSRYTPERATGRRTEVLRYQVRSSKLEPVFNLLYVNGHRHAPGKRITREALSILGGRAASWMWAENARPLGDGHWELRRTGREEEEAMLVSSWIEVMTGARSSVAAPGSGCVKQKLIFAPEHAALLQASLLPYAPFSRRHLFSPAQP